jgi:hypothetical protein
MNGLVRYFDDTIDQTPLIMARLAKWHFEHKRFLESSVMIMSFMVHYCADLLRIAFDGLDYKKAYDLEGTILEKIRTKKKEISNKDARRFLGEYNNFTKIRNTLAHGRLLKKSQYETFRIFVALFDERFVELFIENENTRQQMRKLLEKGTDYSSFNPRRQNHP